MTEYHDHDDERDETLEQFTLDRMDTARALRLVLAGFNEDPDAANAVFAELAGDAAAPVRLAMATADLAIAALARTVGPEAAREHLLADLAAVLDGAGQ